MANNESNDTVPLTNDTTTTIELKALLEQVPEDLLVTTLAEKVSYEPDELSRVLRAVISQEYSGPIPPPQMLSDYEKVEAGLANRLVTMAEEEQKHRQSLESLAVNGEIDKDKRGQQYALTTSLFIILITAILIYFDHEIAATAFGGVTLTGLAYIFISGRKKDDEPDGNEDV